jgi:hypothetical protein
MSRKHLPAAVLVSIGCSVAFWAALGLQRTYNVLNVTNAVREPMNASVHLPGGILSHFRQVTNVSICQGIMKRAIIVANLCLLALPAMGQPYPPDGQYYRCRSELECKIAKALSRALTPPGGYHGATPPIPPSSLPAPPPLATPSQEEWKRSREDQGEPMRTSPQRTAGRGKSLRNLSGQRRLHGVCCCLAST